MSADVRLMPAACDKCGRSDEGEEINITYNLTPMLRAAGFIGWRALVKLDAHEAGWHLMDVLDRMAANPAHFRAMNPANGWGDYDECLQDRLRTFAKACLESPRGSTLDGYL